MTDVIVVGGGLAGLINAILLSRAGLSVTLFEKKEYPFHRVCGEYISNEVIPFLQRNDLFPSEFEPSQISKFILTSTNGKKAEINLDMGGFGISRYAFDQHLFEKALESGVEVIQKCAVDNIQYEEDHFSVSSKNSFYQAKVVIAAQGKRSKLDANLNRPFISRKSPYLGVKYHLKTDFARDTIALHNFKNGYCGISQVENNTFNLCYLSHRDNLREAKDIEHMEETVLSENPFLADLFRNSDFLFDNPLVINEISFEKKSPVENHVLMCGDSAGMITPLCGNGMAMAIHSAKMLSETIIENWNNGKVNRPALETDYTISWNKQFNNRLTAGRTIQKLFGSKWSSNLAVGIARIAPIGRTIVRLTHGKPF